MSFATADHIMSLTESMMCHFLESFNFQFAKPFPVITYREAMNKVSIEFFSLSCCFISLFFLFSTPPPTFFLLSTLSVFLFYIPPSLMPLFSLFSSSSSLLLLLPFPLFLSSFYPLFSFPMPPSSFTLLHLNYTVWF